MEENSAKKNGAILKSTKIPQLVSSVQSKQSLNPSQPRRASTQRPLAHVISKLVHVNTSERAYTIKL